MIRFRVALAAVATVALLTSATSSAAAQDAPAAGRFALRLTSGAFVPTGHQRHALADGQLSAAQLSWTLRPALAVTGTFGWARSRDLGVADAPKLDVFTSDLGLEARRTNALARRAAFVGLGAGVRSYNHRQLDVDATHDLVGYVAAGGEVAVWRLGLRLEARDYLSHDVVVMAALRFHRKPSAER